MKKTFKRAGIAVLSMAMLLSMGAMAMPASAAALPNGSKITINGADGTYNVYQVASSARNAQHTVVYTVNNAYAEVLEFDGGYVVAKDGNKKLSEMTNHSAEIEKVAMALMDKTPADPDATVSVTSGTGELDLSNLGSGYYLIIGSTAGKTQPILVDVVENEDTTSTAAVTKTVKVKYSKLKKKTQKLTAKKVMTISGAKGKVTYKLSSVSKKKYKKYFKVSTATGKVSVKKKLKKGTYKIKVKVTAAGDANYNALTKTITFKIKVK